MTNTNFIGEVNRKEFLESSTPYIGFKVLMFKWNDGDVQVIPPHYHNNITSISGDSHCRKTHDNADAFAKCSCGFYSYAKVKDGVEHADQFAKASNCFFVEVRMSGNVTIAERGYKSSHQRIKSIVVPHCWNCENDSTTFVEHNSGYLVGACMECSSQVSEERVISFQKFSEVTQIEGFDPIIVQACALEPELVNSEIFNNYDENLDLSKALKLLIDKNDFTSIINHKFVVDALVAKLND